MVSAPSPASKRRGSGGERADMAIDHRRASGVVTGAGGGGLPTSSATPRGKGREVGQFVLSKTMGEGTFGEVKLAMHKPTSERVAAKVLEKSRIKTIADVKRVSREIKILKRVRHPNVIALYEVLDTPSTIYFMMEHCDGGELFDFIVKHQRLEEEQACFFFRQLVDGIEYLHDHDVTHRDLKPENLLLQSSADGWQLKIIDFGLSNTHEGGKLLSTACGSPCYAAPEMIAGKSYCGPAADIWSCGVVLFTLVAGFLPFEDPNTSALYKKILAGSYEKPCWLSDGAVHILSRILETNPVKRAAVAEIRAHPWYIGAHPPAARPTAAPHPAVPSRRSHLNENILAHAVSLASTAGGRVRGGEGGANKGRTGGAVVATTAAGMEAAAEGLLSGRHDAVGTAYHLLLKKSLRERDAMGAGNGDGGGNGKVAVGRGGNTTGDSDGVVRDRDVGNVRVPGRTRNQATTASALVGVGDRVGTSAGGGGDSSGSSREAKHGTVRVTDGKPSATVVAPRVASACKGNASYASSTSSSRSGRQPSVCLQDSSSPAPVAEGATLRHAQQGESSSVSKVLNARPHSYTRDVARPHSAAESRRGVGTTPGDMAGVASMQGEGPGRGSSGGDEQRPGSRVEKRASRPVPKLSLRAVARTGANGTDVGSRGGSRTVTSSAIFGSQTARNWNGPTPTSQAAAMMNSVHQRRGGHHVHARRESGGGSTSSAGSGGSGSGSGGSTGRRLVAGRTAAPRRPLTARAPLRSSAPTPRLSGDFSLARPRGAPTSSTNGSNGNRPSVSPSPRTASLANGNPSSGAPLAAEVQGSVVAPTTMPQTAGTAVAPPSPASPRPKPQQQQQPSLRVRLSTLSSKPSQRWRDQSAGDTKQAATAVAMIDKGDGIDLARGPGDPSSSSGSSSPAVPAAAAAIAGGSGGVSAARHFWQTTVSSVVAGSSGGARAPQVITSSSKAWSRGAPIAVFRRGSRAPPAVRVTAEANKRPGSERTKGGG